MVPRERMSKPSPPPLKPSPSHTHGSIRFSLGKWTIEEEIEQVLEVMPQVLAKLRAMSPLVTTG